MLYERVLFRTIVFIFLLSSLSWAGRFRDIPAWKRLGATSRTRFCKELSQASFLPSTPIQVPGATGLWVLEQDAFSLEGKEPGKVKEFTSSAKYAGAIHQTRGESLLFVPAFEGVEVPAYDGVIRDVHGRFISNYSLKAIYSRNLTRRVLEAKRKIEEYSATRSWSVNLVVPSGGHRDRAFFDPKLWLTKVFGIFGIVQSRARKRRPTRIVVDLLEAESMPDQSEIENLRKMLGGYSSNIESITLMRGSEVLEITKAPKSGVMTGP